MLDPDGLDADQWAAIDAVPRGALVRCSPEAWPAVRRALQEQAGKWIDTGQGIRAVIALREVERLDAELAYHPGGAG
jgi:hypothetical protein